MSGFRRGAIGAAAAIFSVLGTGAARAQTIKGRVADSATVTPLSGVTVTMLDTSGVPVAVGQSGKDGTFSVRAKSPGFYRTQFRHIGFDSLSSQLFRLTNNGTIEIDVGMHQTGVAIDTVVSRAKSGNFFTSVTRGREIFRQHFILGQGQFASGWAIEKSGMLLSEYLTKYTNGFTLIPRPPQDELLPIVPAAHDLALAATETPHCLYARIDRTALPRFMVVQNSISIDELVPVNAVMAVELYRTVAEAPPDWKIDATGARLVLVSPPASTSGSTQKGFLIGDVGTLPLFQDDPTIDPRDRFGGGPLGDTLIKRPVLGVDTILSRTSIGLDEIPVADGVLSQYHGIAVKRSAASQTAARLIDTPGGSGGPSCALLQIWTHNAW